MNTRYPAIEQFPRWRGFTRQVAEGGCNCGDQRNEIHGSDGLSQIEAVETGRCVRRQQYWNRNGNPWQEESDDRNDRSRAGDLLAQRHGSDQRLTLLRNLRRRDPGRRREQAVAAQRLRGRRRVAPADSFRIARRTWRRRDLAFHRQYSSSQISFRLTWPLKAWRGTPDKRVRIHPR